MKWIKKIAQSRLCVPVCGTLSLLAMSYIAFSVHGFVQQTPMTQRIIPVPEWLQESDDLPAFDAIYEEEMPEWDADVPEIETFTAREEIALPEACPSESTGIAPETEIEAEVDTQIQTEAVTTKPKPQEGAAQTQKPASTTKPVPSTQKPQQSTGTTTAQPVSGWSVTYAQAKGMVKADSAYDYEDLYWLARIISAEAKGESFTGQIGVGTVVLNRVRSKEFPNTVKGVVFDQKYGTQFTPVANGTIYEAPTQSAIVAAKMCLDGYTLSDSVLYFLNPRIATSSWIQNNRKYAFRIGNHDFYH